MTALITKSTTPTVLPSFEDNTLLAALISAKGDIQLAAERLQVSELDLTQRLQSLPFSTLSDSVNSIALFQMLDTLKYVQLEVISKLDSYSPSTTSKLLIDLLDRLNTLSNPPTSDNNSSHPIVIQQMMMNESSHVREELARRIINAQSTPEPDRGLLVIEHDDSN